MVDLKRIDDHFTARVPTARPLTKTDWEGAGLEPDVKVADADALDVALEVAAEAIARNRSNLAEGR